MSAALRGDTQRPGPPGDGEDGRAGAQPGPRHDQRRQHLVAGCRRQQEVGREADGLPQHHMIPAGSAPWADPAMLASSASPANAATASAAVSRPGRCIPGPPHSHPTISTTPRYSQQHRQADRYRLDGAEVAQLQHGRDGEQDRRPPAGLSPPRPGSIRC